MEEEANFRHIIITVDDAVVAVNAYKLRTEGGSRVLHCEAPLLSSKYRDYQKLLDEAVERVCWMLRVSYVFRFRKDGSKSAWVKLGFEILKGQA